MLDFIGYHRKEFSFDASYRALTGDTRPASRRRSRRAFHSCRRDARSCWTRGQTLVLDNIRSQIANRWQQIVAELASYGDQVSRHFLKTSGLELSDILRRGSHSWTRLRRDAGLPDAPGSDLEEKLLKRVRAFAHVDDPDGRRPYHAPLRDDAPTTQICRRPSNALLACSSTRSGPTAAAMPRTTMGSPLFVREPRTRARSPQLSTCPSTQLATLPIGLEGSLATSRSRSMRATSARRSSQRSTSRGSPNSFREGVWYSPDLNVDAFFVTLKKSEADYSPTTMYARLPDQPRTLPLGVAVHDLGRLADGTSLPVGHRAPC